uniref:Cytochrome b6-f complex subunit petP n=1 Tax=Betaphycus gelatinus TaxID=1191690 RepID=A0A8E7PG11_9FLOR|nr:cytochrome b6-f complex subunit petP [Betaphycus gelatinus]
MNVHDLNVKIKKLHKKYNRKLINYLYKPGVMAGKKTVNKKSTVYIIEFDDYTRIWFFQKELKFIKYQKN